MKLKKGKAAEADKLPAEAPKADIATTVEMLCPLFARMWEVEKLPTWREVHFIKLPKISDLSKCSIYRGITLLSVPGKIFNSAILERVKDTINSQLIDQQVGCRKNRYCTGPYCYGTVP